MELCRYKVGVESCGQEGGNSVSGVDPWSCGQECGKQWIGRCAWMVMWAGQWAGSYSNVGSSWVVKVGRYSHDVSGKWVGIDK